MSIIRYIVLGGIIYTGAALLSNAVINAVLYQPPRATYTAQEPGLIWLESSPGIKIAGLWLPNPVAKCTILYAHGNAVDLGYLRSTLKRLNNLGFNVLAFDYQGYGLSPGQPSEKNTYADIHAAYNFLTQKEHIPSDRIILFGVSLGTGPTLELAKKIPSPAAIILQSPYLSVYRRALGFPIFPFDRYNNIQKIDKVSAPLLIVHGSSDFIIPIHHGRNLYERANQPKQALWVKGAGHNNLFYASGGAYEKAILSIASGCTDALR